MGVDIGDIVERKSTSLKDHSGSVMALDAYKIIYQFLSSIRQPDGTPLMDNEGNVTSHLSGVFYRTTSMLENGIKPIYVFDGKPSELKNRTIEERRRIKEKSRLELEAAIEEGDTERIRSLSARVNYITPAMVQEVKELLTYMGLPHVQAPSEGEAQASEMSARGLADGVISQDFDCLLFGARKLYRNFAFTGRRKLPGRSIYVNVIPEEIDLEATLARHQLTRDQLIDIGMMVGTDFNGGLKRVGPKSALALIKKYGSLEAVLAAKNVTIDNYELIRDLFRNPPYVEVKDLQFIPPDLDKLMDFLCEKHSFSAQRVQPYADSILKSSKSRTQSSLDSF